MPRVSYTAKSFSTSRSRPSLQLETSSFGYKFPSCMSIFGPKTVKIGGGHPRRLFWTSRSRPSLQLETSSFGYKSPSYMFIFGPKTVKIGDGHPWRPFWTKVLLTSELPNGPRVRPHERGTSFLRPKLLTPLKCHQGPHCNSLQMSFHPRGASCSWSLILSEKFLP